MAKENYDVLRISIPSAYRDAIEETAQDLNKHPQDVAEGFFRWLVSAAASKSDDERFSDPEVLADLVACAPQSVRFLFDRIEQREIEPTAFFHEMLMAADSPVTVSSAMQ